VARVGSLPDALGHATPSKNLSGGGLWGILNKPGNQKNDWRLRWHPSPCFATHITHESRQISASRALSRLTTVNENKVSVFCSGGLKPLIQLCTSSDLDVSLTSIMVLCNLSTCSGYQIKFVEENGLPTVNQLLTSVFPLISKYATMILCNLTSHQLLQDHVSRQISLMHLVDLMNDINLECRAFATMTICNLASKVNHGSIILDARRLRPLLTMVNSKDGTNLQRGALLTLYNLSACETSHPLFVENNVTPSIVTIINGSPDLLCRRFA
jgi:hypothetical protein